MLYKLSDLLRCDSGLAEPHSMLETRILQRADMAEELEKRNQELRNELLSLKSKLKLK